MCGITGVFAKQNLDLMNLTETMLRKIKHRGPDQIGINQVDNVGLGMVRLSIVDSREHVIPYTNEDRTVHLVYNGEIYNHREMRNELKHKHRFNSESDTETIVHAYEEWGLEKLLNKMNGMFAFALYDQKLGKLFLARDIAGEKNIYFRETSEGLYFASEIKCFSPLWNLTENSACQSYKAFEICCERETLFDEIHSLLPGEYATYDGKSLNFQRYWDVADNLMTDLPTDEEGLCDYLDNLIHESVRLRTGNSAFEYGCLISGGVDSSLLSAISKPTHLFTLTYDLGDDFNELRYAEKVAKSIGKDLTIVRPSKEDFEQFREEIIYHLDFPCTWTSFNMYCILKEASKHVKVILSGEGVDELFGGYYRYHLLNHDEQIYSLKAMDKYFPLINKYYGPSYERYAKLINRADEKEEEILGYVESVTKRYFEPFDKVIHGMGLTDFYTSMQVLLHMADRMSMAHSIENRAPFLDPNLIRFAFSLPAEFKIKNGVAKYLFKKVASRYIPEEVAFRADKRGFVAPVNHWYQGEKKSSDSPLKQFDRSFYKNMVYSDWKKVFQVV